MGCKRCSRSPSRRSRSLCSCPITSCLKSCSSQFAFFVHVKDADCRCDPGTQSVLANLTWQGLLTSLDGRDIARKLVTALIEQQIGQELGVR